MNNLFMQKNLVLPTFILDAVKKLDLNLNEFILLLYFWNEVSANFDISVISNVTHLKENDILTAFNSLINKKVITLETSKDQSGKRREVVDLKYFYMMLSLDTQKEEKKQEEKDIYSIFESEFGRPISSMEYEIIRAWMEKGFSEELILGALKEAVYNGVNNLRYIDKILYEWQRKGYKNMKDVSSRKSLPTEESKPLFDYNWLDDNE
jgi:DNA replication protein